ncbi:hypothetical protein WHI96_25030 [Pseudonocardia tropica]|uniref:Uncharacterized protein n=1 Tax=Pseudonocardia tropica TaxID=681289 RepID=A0ABV1K1H5_9PSEU
MTSNHRGLDNGGGADDGEFDADDPDDYGHVPFPARRHCRGIDGPGGQVTARFADGSLWLAYTGTGEGRSDCTGVFDPLATEDYRPPTEHD